MPEREIFEYSEDVWIWILRIFVTMIIVMFIFVFTWAYFNKDTSTEKLELISLTNRLLFSPDCLAYSSNDEVEPGTIDPSKFEDIRMNKCFEKNNYDFELKLYDLNNNEIKKIKSSEKGLELSPLCNSLSNIKCSNSKEYVLIKNQDKIEPAILEIITLKNV